MSDTFKVRQLCFYLYASDHAPCDPVLGMDGIIEAEFQARDVTIVIKEARKKRQVKLDKNIAREWAQENSKRTSSKTQFNI